MAETLQERLRILDGTWDAGSVIDICGEAADALDAAQAEIAKHESGVVWAEQNKILIGLRQEIAKLTAERDELLAKVAGLEGRIAGMRDAGDAAWNEAIIAACEQAEAHAKEGGHVEGCAAAIRQLKRAPTEDEMPCAPI